ncbi:MAG: SpoIIE family protein phosphatase [Thiotrichaceae bacterium]|nr:SpoIIE family protein phosphatase [Thiotrichaceae bacterium]
MNILVVDDAADMRMIIRQLLIQLGHTVDTAIDGEDAWTKILEGNYQTIVCDWIMPKLDGLELCKRIRSHDFDSYLYIILLTGMSGKQNLISALDAGTDDFATKPVSKAELQVRLCAAHRVLTLEHSLAKKNAALIEMNRHIDEDLRNAYITQRNLLPAPIRNNKLTTSWLYEPAIFVGGDTFNYYSPTEDLLVFFSLDISGHGISAAMLSMSLQSSMSLKRGLYGNPVRHDTIYDMPSTFAKNANKLVLENESSHYLTMIFGIVDFKEKEIHFVQAGHPYPLFYKAQEKQLEEIKITGFPIGLFAEAEYETQHLSFASGDKFILYSDGISENDSVINNAPLEGDNLIEHFEQIKEKPAAEITEHVHKHWLSEEQMKSLPDDLSLLVLEFQ